MTCTCCTTPGAGMRCRCWPITFRPGRGWCWRAGAIRRYESRGCAPRAGSSRSAPTTERWPAGLYLAALYLKEGGPVETAAVSFGGDDRLVSQYMESEFLARISARHRLFLTRTAVLEPMCGPLCEAVLAEPGSAEVLADLAG